MLMFVAVMIRAQVGGREGRHVANILKRLHPLEHACLNEALSDGFAPVLAGRLGHAAALEGHDADAVRPEFDSKLPAQDIDRTQGVG
jgi:hypothetical protein